MGRKSVKTLRRPGDNGIRVGLLEYYRGLNKIREMSYYLPRNKKHPKGSDRINLTEGRGLRKLCEKNGRDTCLSEVRHSSSR